MKNIDLLGSNLLFLLKRKLAYFRRIILMKKVLIFLCFIKVISINAQEIYQSFSAIVENEVTGFPMESVHVVNLNIIVGATTNEKGVFEIPAKVNDTLYFSYLGFKPLKVAVTQDMVKFKNSKFKLTELAFALEEIILRPYQLTGYLDIDVKKVPIKLRRGGIVFLDYQILDMKEEVETPTLFLKPLLLFSTLQIIYIICSVKIRFK